MVYRSAPTIINSIEGSPPRNDSPPRKDTPPKEEDNSPRKDTPHPFFSPKNLECNQELSNSDLSSNQDQSDKDIDLQDLTKSLLHEGGSLAEFALAMEMEGKLFIPNNLGQNHPSSKNRGSSR